MFRSTVTWFCGGRTHRYRRLIIFKRCLVFNRLIVTNLRRIYCDNLISRNALISDEIFEGNRETQLPWASHIKVCGYLTILGSGTPRNILCIVSRSYIIGSFSLNGCCTGKGKSQSQPSAYHMAFFRFYFEGLLILQGKRKEG